MSRLDTLPATAPEATTPVAAPPSSTSEDFQRIMQQPMGQGNVITPRELYGDMSRTWRFAKALARGCGLGTGDEGAEIAMARIFIGAEMGIGPAASVRGIHFIKTRVALSADLMVAMAQDQGWEFEIQHSDPPGMWCEVKATHERRKSYGFKWTMDMARKAGLVRGGSGWESYPYDMLYARAASHVARKVASGRLMGLYTPEEARAIPVEDPDADKGNGLADRLNALPKNGNGHKTAPVDPDAHEQPPIEESQVPQEQKPTLRAQNIPPDQDGASTEQQQRRSKPRETTPPPDLSTWEKFYASAMDIAQRDDISPDKFEKAIHAMLLPLGKIGKEKTIAQGQLLRWYGAMDAKTFDWSTGRIAKL